MDNQNTFAAGPSTVVTPSFTPQNVSTPAQSVPEPRREQTVQQLGTNPSSQPYTLEDLESPSTANLNMPQPSAQPTQSNPVNTTPETQPNTPMPDQKNGLLRKILIGAAIVGVVVFLSALGVVFIARNRQAPQENVGEAIPDQQIDLSVGQAKGAFDLTIEGQENKLIVNGSVVSRGDVILTAEDESAYGQISAQNLTGVYTYLLPNAAGTFCLDSNNCNYLQETDVTTTTVAGASGSLQLGDGLTINGNTIVNTATNFTETAINNFGGAVTIQGTTNQVNVANNSGIITLSAPQDLAIDSSPTFNTITLNTAGTQNGNEICDISNNCGYAGGTNAFVQDGNSFDETARLGTNDNNALVFETNNTIRAQLGVNGHFGLGNNGANTDDCSLNGGEYEGAPCASVLNVQQLMTGPAELYEAGINNALVLSHDDGDSPSVTAGIGNFVTTDELKNTDYEAIYGDITQVLHMGSGNIGSAAAGIFVLGIGGGGSMDTATGIQTNVTNFAGGDIIRAVGADINVSSETGNVYTVIGVNSSATSNGDATDLRVGVYTEAGSSGGNTTTNIGVDVSTGIFGAGNIADNYGVRVQTALQAGGAITNNYGIYVEDQSGVASGDNYNIYSEGTGYNRFEGHTGIGNYSSIEVLMNTAVLAVIDETSESGYGIIGGLDVTATTGGNVNNAIVADLGLRGDQDYAAGAGIGATARSYTTGTVNLLAAMGGGIYNYDTGTVLQGMGLYIAAAENTGGGVITENYGVYVQGQNAGAADYGIRIDTADTQTLWLAGDADNINANAGIAFGQSRDTNLYRSDANVLRTDDALSIGTLAATDNASYLCLNSGGIVAGCSGTATGSAFVQGGNSFGGTATLGTNDANILAFETNNTTRLTIGANNGKIVHTPSTITSTTAADDIAHTITFNDTGVVSTGNDITRGLAVTVSRTGGTGTANLTTYGGSFAAIGDTGGTSSTVGVFSYGVNADSNIGVAGVGFQAGSNITASVIGVQGTVETYQGTLGGTVTNAYGLSSSISMGGGNSTFTTAAGLNVSTATNGTGGVITNNYGIKIETQTAGVADYGIRIDAADTQTVWISGNADNTTAAAGIAFGSSRDTNLYRSAADTLKTDDNVDIAQKLQVGGNSSFTQCSIITGLTNCTKSFEQVLASTSTTTQTWGANFATGITPSGATNTQSNRGINGLLALYGSQSFSGANRAIYGAATNVTSAGTVALLGGVYGEASQFGVGSIVTEAVGVGAMVLQSNGTLTTGYGMRVMSATGTIGTNYGLHVQTQTTGTTDYGIRVDTADTQTLWIAGDAANPTTASAGIAFGSSRDTNLYRSGTDTLKTDDSLEVGTKMQVGSSSIGTLSQCGTVIGLFTCNNTFEQGAATTETSVQTYGANFVTGITPAGATNTVDNRAVNAMLGLYGTQSFNSTSGNYAINGSAVSGTTSGTIALMGGINGAATQGGAGSTVTEAFGLQGIVAQSAGTLSTGYGLRILSASGTIGNNYGVHVQAQTAGTNDYGIRVDAADTQTLWVSGNADNTTANAGIAFGISRDTNLYRSAAETLKTDDNLSVVGNVGVGIDPGTYKLNVSANAASGHVANFFNDGNDANRNGIRIQAGADDASGTTAFLDGYDGDGNQVGYVGMNGGTFQVVNVSDARTKTNISDTGVNALNVLGQLRVVDYNRAQNPGGPLITGFIAQEVQGVYGQAVSTTSSGLLGVSNDAFIPVLVKGVQEQQSQIDELQAQIDALQAQTSGVNTSTSSSSSTLSTLNVSGSATVQSLVVKGSATIEGTLNVEGSVTIGGNLTVNGHIIGNEDTRGVVTMPAGETEVEHTFEAAFKDGTKPNIILTATNAFAPSYRVESDEDSFTVYFQNASSTPVKLNYQVQQ